ARPRSRPRRERLPAAASRPLREAHPLEPPRRVPPVAPRVAERGAGRRARAGRGHVSRPPHACGPRRDRAARRIVVYSGAMKLLVVDDDVHIRRIVALYLRDHAVAEAATAEEALARVGGETVDTVIVDVILPHFGGL